MHHEYLDRALAADEQIVPSSGFTGAVMEAVLREAWAPPPIPFPWRRTLPGLILAALAVVALVLIPIPRNIAGGAEPSTTQITTTLAPLLEAIRRFGVNWLLAGLLVSWACMRLSMTLVSWKPDGPG